MQNTLINTTDTDKYGNRKQQKHITCTEEKHKQQHVNVD